VFSLLCQTARPALVPADERSLHETLSQLPESAWNDLISQAVIHGTAGLLCDHLLTHSAAALPAEMRRACSEFLAAGQSAFAHGLQQLGQIVSALRHAGIPAVPFKGPVTALRIYPRPALRQSRDLDLLIAAADRERAFEVLAHCGYRSAVDDLTPGRRRAYLDYNGQDILFAPERYPVEPHWALAPRTFSAELDVPGLIQRAVAVPVRDCSLPGLSPEDALLVAALHGAKEEWARLIWVADIAAMLLAWPELNTDLLLARARASGCLRVLLLAVLLARDLLGVAAPEPLARRAEADPTADALAKDIAERLPRLRGEAPSVFQLTRFRWRVRERQRDRLRYAARTLADRAGATFPHRVAAGPARVPVSRGADWPRRAGAAAPARLASRTGRPNVIARSIRGDCRTGAMHW